MQIPQIEPFQYECCTAFKERVALADKVNEIIDGINSLGEIPDLQAQIDAIKGDVDTIKGQIADTNSSIDAINASIADLQTKYADLQTAIGGLDTRMTAAETTISGHTTEIAENSADIESHDTRITGAENSIDTLKEDVDAADARIVTLETQNTIRAGENIQTAEVQTPKHGTIQIVLNKSDGTPVISQPIDLGLVMEAGITLETGSTERSFKLVCNLTDGTHWQTNDFVIPEGGGTEVVVTNVRIVPGSQNDMFRVSIGLSDGTPIESNDWQMVSPDAFVALQTQVTTNTGGIADLKDRADTADSERDALENKIDEIDTRVKTLEDNPGYSLSPATGDTLGGVKVGSGILVSADGTISIDTSKFGTGLIVGSDGMVSVAPATGTSIGGVKAGNGITVGTDGTASVDPSKVITEVSGSFADGTLRVTVNGVSGDIPLGDLSGVVVTVTVTSSTLPVSGQTVQATDGTHTFAGITNDSGAAQIVITENGTYTFSVLNVNDTTTATVEYTPKSDVNLIINNWIAVDLYVNLGSASLGTISVESTTNTASTNRYFRSTTPQTETERSIDSPPYRINSTIRYQSGSYTTNDPYSPEYSVKPVNWNLTNPIWLPEISGSLLSIGKRVKISLSGALYLRTGRTTGDTSKTYQSCERLSRNAVATATFEPGSSTPVWSGTIEGTDPQSWFASQSSRYPCNTSYLPTAGMFGLPTISVEIE